MRYFVPNLDVLAAGAAAPKERLGGVPVGLQAAAWPVCRECGKSLSLLAQFEHQPERLDLGRLGRMLFVFMCGHGTCATWEMSSGANACFVVEPEDVGNALTDIPIDAPPVENCAVIMGWQARDDALTKDDASAFLSDDSLSQIPEEKRDTVTYSTRLGGVPSWVQNADEAPRPGWHFLGQIEGTYNFLKPPTVPASWVLRDPKNFEGRTHYGLGPTFGDAGIAYLFARKRVEALEVVMFWQCY